MSDVDDNMSDSAKDFSNIVEPAICDWFDGEVINVENVTESEIAEALDVNAGIDYWRVGDLMSGIGSRVQWLDETRFASEPYDTFTVRCETEYGVQRSEYEKRLEAIEDGGLYPRQTVQAYLDTRHGELLSVGAVSTEELIKHIKNGDQGERTFNSEGKPVAEDGEYWRQERSNENDFYAVAWSQLQSNQYGVHVRQHTPYKEGPKEAVTHKSQSALGEFIADGGNR